jgi:hypothetical protein
MSHLLHLTQPKMDGLLIHMFQHQVDMRLLLTTQLPPQKERQLLMSLNQLQVDLLHTLVQAQLVLTHQEAL